jgi:macrodomain Ter protein organizer (MatP/YcbG family)
MNITLKNTKTAKTTTGIYLEVALLDKLNTIAKKNKLSISETMVQLIELGMEKAGELNNG